MYQHFAMLILVLLILHPANVQSICLGVSECDCEPVPDGSGQVCNLGTVVHRRLANKLFQKNQRNRLSSFVYAYVCYAACVVYHSTC